RPNLLEAVEISGRLSISNYRILRQDSVSTITPARLIFAKFSGLFPNGPLTGTVKTETQGVRPQDCADAFAFDCLSSIIAQNSHTTVGSPGSGHLISFSLIPVSSTHSARFFLWKSDSSAG